MGPFRRQNGMGAAPANGGVQPGLAPAPQVQMLPNGQQAYAGPVPTNYAQIAQSAQYPPAERVGGITVPSQFTGNANTDAWLEQRSNQYTEMLSWAARNAGLAIGPTTVLRPEIRRMRFVGFNTLTEEGSPPVITALSASLFFSRAAYISKVTARAVGLTLTDPIDTSLVGTVVPTDFFEAQLIRAVSEQIMTEPIILTEWVGPGSLPYLWDLVPFVNRSDTLRVNLSLIPNAANNGYLAESCTLVELAFHTMYFPIDGT